MKKIRMVGGVATLLVVVAVGVAALLLSDPDGSISVSATQACDLMSTPYDTLVTASVPGAELRTEIRASGSDRHVVSTTKAPSGVLLGKGEMIVKDRTRYSRESSPGNPEIYGEWRVFGTNVPRPFSIPCLDTSKFGPDSSGSSSEPHFTSERFLSEEEGAERNEFWADATGRPTRARRTIFPPEYDGVSNTDTGVVEYTYSDYGQPNIIEAPCAGAAPDQADNPGLMRDCVNLLAAKDTLRGSATLNWSVETAITSWDGVTVEGTPSRVTELALYTRGLSGVIPSELGDLTALERLLLTSNELTGTIPTELADLTALVDLVLSDNQLTGTIPSELADLTALEDLLLSGNELTGTIPSELSRLANLQHLWLNKNRLTGTIPPELGGMTNLQSLLASRNSLSGSIPSELGGLTDLRSLWLHENQLSGSIPPELGGLTNLENLLLSGNRLTGAIPSELGGLSDLDALWLNNNQLTGEIPASLGTLTNLQELGLANNQLTGCIPPTLRNVGENDLDNLSLQNCPTLQ